MSETETIETKRTITRIVKPRPWWYWLPIIGLELVALVIVSGM